MTQSPRQTESSQSAIVLDEDESFENNGSGKAIPVPKLNLKAISTTPPSSSSSNDSLVKAGGIYLLESTIKNSKKRDSPKDSTNPSLKKFKDSNIEVNTPVSPTPEVTHKLNMLLSSCDSPIDSPKDALSPHTRSNINNILLTDNKNNESFEMPNNFVITKSNSSLYNGGSNNNTISSGSSSPSTSPSPSPSPSNSTIIKGSILDSDNEKKYRSLLDEKNQMEKELKNQINTLKQQLQQQHQQQQQQLHQVHQQILQQQQQQHSILSQTPPQQQQQTQQPPPTPTPATTSKSKNPLSSRSNPVGTNDPIIVQDYLLNEIKVLKLKIIESQNQMNESNGIIKTLGNRLDELRQCFGDYKVQTEGHFSLIEERLHNYALKFGEIDKFIYPYYIYPSTPKTPVSPHQLTPKDPNSPLYYNDPRMQMLTPKPSIHINQQQPPPPPPSSSSQSNSNSPQNNNNSNLQNNTSQQNNSNNIQNGSNGSNNSNSSNQQNTNLIINDDKKNISQKLHQRVQLQEQQKQQQLQQQQSTSVQSTQSSNKQVQPNSPKGPMMMDRQPMSPHSQVPNVVPPHYVDINGYPPQDQRYYYGGYHPSTLQYYQ